MDVDSIRGMTVNERLFHFGLIQRFDAAAKLRDFEMLVHILLEAKFSRTQAEETARALIANPRRYRF